MEFITRIDNDILAVMVILIILFRIKRNHNKDSIQSRIFYYLTVTVLSMLIFDMIVWTVNGIDTVFFRFLNYWSNYAQILLSPVPLVLWLIYISYIVHKDLKRVKKNILVFMMPQFITTLMMLATLFNDFVFYIDESNLYHRNIGIYLVFGIMIFMIIVTLIYSLMVRKKLKRNALFSVVSFGILPLVGGLLQILFYGTSLIWSFSAIAVLVLYVFIEFNEISIDHLTGLCNRKRVDEYIHYEMRIAKSRGEKFSLIMIDLDGFKDINDTYGHAEGDHALTTFAGILLHSVKMIDMVARYAGDEFLIVLHIDNEEDLLKVVERIKKNTDNYNAKKLVPYDIKFSVGHIVYDPDKIPYYKDLLKEVDHRMYSDKNKRMN